MNIFIVKTFQKACKQFTMLPKLDRLPSLEKYYFNENALSVGKPPSDRGCHYCRSIGHVQKDCPKLQMLNQKLGPPGPRHHGQHNRAGNMMYDNRQGRGGDRRDQNHQNHQRGGRDNGRLSNMPMPPGMNLPMALQMRNAHMQNHARAMQHQQHQQNHQQQHQQNHPRPMGAQNQGRPLQNHVVVGTGKPPGFQGAPPGFPHMGPPLRMMAPQMTAQMAAQMAPQMAAQMRPQMVQGAGPPFLMARPVRPYQWQ